MKKLIPVFLFLFFIFPQTVFGQLSEREESDAKQEKAWQFFLSHLDEPLTYSNQSEQEYKQRLDYYNSLTKQRTKGFMPLRFQMLEWPAGNSFFVLLAQPEFITFPGLNEIIVHTFNAEGTEGALSGFACWDREYSTLAAKAKSSKFVPSPIIQISLKGKKQEFRIADVFLALKKDRWIVVRLEDENGMVLPNDYRKDSPLGFESPSSISPPDLLVLNEADPVLTLESLLWLGGIHNSFEKDTFPIIRLARNSPEVREKLKTLASSKNKWIREAAQLALSPPIEEEAQ